jgi:hypothetical protein
LLLANANAMIAAMGSISSPNSGRNSVPDGDEPGHHPAHEYHESDRPWIVVSVHFDLLNAAGQDRAAS